MGTSQGLNEDAHAPVRYGERPSPLMLPLMKLPLVMYRLRLGWLLGHRFMRLTHVGRKSGKVRHTILAVLNYDPASREVMLVSAWSASEWYRNVHAAPALEVETGRDRYAPEQRDLSTEEIAVVLDGFRRQNPMISRIFCRIPGWSYPDSEEKAFELARRLRGVAFRPLHS